MAKYVHTAQHTVSESRPFTLQSCCCVAEMLLKVMNLTPDAIARLSESQQQQVDKVKRWAADHGIKI